MFCEESFGKIKFRAFRDVVSWSASLGSFNLSDRDVFRLVVVCPGDMAVRMREVVSI